MKVCIRADASVRIGSGHVVRCLTLADELRNGGSEAQFICRAFDGNLIEMIEDRGYRVDRLQHTESQGSELDWQADAQQTCEAIGGESVDWMIVDHYGLDARWQQLASANWDRLLVIDDLADRPHLADVLVDQNFRQSQQGRYERHVPASCRLLLGPQFALLRPEFAKAREAIRISDPSPLAVAGPIETFIFLGGMDEYNVTSDVMLAIESAVHRCLISSALNLHVVVGKTNPNQREVQRHCARLDRLPKISARLYVQVTDMAGLLARMNLAIAAGGTHTWERCCLGIPTATIAVADNQVDVAEQMALASASVYLGQSHRFSLPQWSESIADFLSDTQAHTKMRLTSLALVDGKGANRVASLILGNAQSSAA